MDDQSRWNTRYQAQDTEPHAAQVLTDNLQLLPTSGKALDLACGLGGNALLLAQHGLNVEAWDIANVAIDRLNTQSKNLSIQTKVIDISPASFCANQFDVIVISYFLDRTLTQALINALKPNGLLFYQTFNQHQLGRGPRNPDYRLQDNELLQMFRALSVRYYREDASVGNLEQGIRDEAMLVAMKE